MERAECPIAGYLSKAEEIAIYTEGKRHDFPAGSGGYRAALSAADTLLAEARQMPAFGVSIDKMTRHEMCRGLWIEFLFKGEEVCAELPFASLLFSVKEEYRGFNIVRKAGGQYAGRCYYVDLGGKNMSVFAASVRQLVGKGE